MRGRTFPRPNFEDWERALRRAYAERIELKPHPTSGTVMLASSTSTPGRWYVVNEFACNCIAGLRAKKLGGCCDHRALYLMRHADRLGGLVTDPFAAPVREEEVA